MFTLRMFPEVMGPGLIVAAMIALNTPVSARESGANPFAVVNRTITQEQGDWRVDYQIRLGGTTG